MRVGLNREKCSVYPFIVQSDLMCSLQKLLFFRMLFYTMRDLYFYLIY